MSWTFYLTITNATDRTLEVASSSIEWGTWYRDSKDNNGPCSIPPNTTIQALGIRAAKGTWTGYECHAQWKDKVPPGEKGYGAVTLMIDVPFSGSNDSSLTTGGALTSYGWQNLPSSGHDFNRSVTIRAGRDKKLIQMEDMMPIPVEKKMDPVEMEYREYLLELAAKNPDVRDWDQVEKGLEQVDDFNPLQYIPEGPYLTRRLLARSEPLVLSNDLWDGIGDPDYPTPYAQSLFLDEYFSVAIYSVGNDPRSFINIPAGSSRKTSEKVTVTSAIKNVLTVSWSLKTSLSEKAVEPVSGSEVASTLDMEFGVTDVLEVSRESVTEKIVEQEFKAPDDSDVLIVPWVFSTAVLIYRRSKKGKVSLVAVSEWAQMQFFKSYRVHTQFKLN
ncbi:hypothetical protein IM880_11500 [Pectobacterium polaris]|uniref:Insecticidal crystal toxin domain-containing protein n=1 Tax=Pectobacterium polaris TaxID=2042057 RepID=A0AAW4P0G9_9GAMM|nr:hypothetical protein [Pectobacterium polaris]MBW5892839.1 hypothetical protein [Pectobacterium polaris]